MKTLPLSTRILVAKMTINTIDIESLHDKLVNIAPLFSIFTEESHPLYKKAKLVKQMLSCTKKLLNFQTRSSLLDIKEVEDCISVLEQNKSNINNILAEVPSMVTTEDFEDIVTPCDTEQPHINWYVDGTPDIIPNLEEIGYLTDNTVFLMANNMDEIRKTLNPSSNRFGFYDEIIESLSLINRSNPNSVVNENDLKEMRKIVRLLKKQAKPLAKFKDMVYNYQYESIEDASAILQDLVVFVRKSEEIENLLLKYTRSLIFVNNPAPITGACNA